MRLIWREAAKPIRRVDLPFALCVRLLYTFLHLSQRAQAEHTHTNCQCGRRAFICELKTKRASSRTSPCAQNSLLGSKSLQTKIYIRTTCLFSERTGFSFGDRICTVENAFSILWFSRDFSVISDSFALTIVRSCDSQRLTSKCRFVSVLSNPHLVTRFALFLQGFLFVFSSAEEIDLRRKVLR